MGECGCVGLCGWVCVWLCGVLLVVHFMHGGAAYAFGTALSTMYMVCVCVYFSTCVWCVHNMCVCRLSFHAPVVNCVCCSTHVLLVVMCFIMCVGFFVHDVFACCRWFLLTIVC